MKNLTKKSKKVAMPRVTYLDRILNYLTEEPQSLDWEFFTGDKTTYAIEAVKKGNIRGGVATAIEAEMLVRLNENLQKAEESGNENDIVKAIEAFNEMTTMMMKDQTEMGQRLSMWNKIFKTSQKLLVQIKQNHI